MRAGRSPCAPWRRRCVAKRTARVSADHGRGGSFCACAAHTLTLLFFSPQARDHARQLLEKHVQKPFFESATYANGKERMSPDEVQRGLTWLSERFVLIRFEDEELPSIDWVLDTARAAVMRCVVGRGAGFGFGRLHTSSHGSVLHGIECRTAAVAGRHCGALVVWRARHLHLWQRWGAHFVR